MVVHTESQTAPGWDSDASQLQGVSNGAGFIQGDRVLKYQQHFDFSLDDEPMIHWTNTFNMRQVTLSNLSGNTLRSMVQRTLNPHIRGRCVMSASKSLDVLRQNLQAAINKDIDAVIQGYLEKYFAPAIHNIRVNLGQTSVSEEHLREVCRSILDEAKLFYSARIGSRGNSPPNDADYAFSKTTCSPRSPLFHGTTRSRKREAEDSNVDTQAQQAKQSRREAPYNVPESKLDPLRFDANSQFMLSTRAQKVLGLRSGGSSVRLPASLLRYPIDSEDREWLSSHKLLSSSSPHLYLIPVEDVRELAVQDEYRSNAVLKELKGFHIPELMLIKVQNYMTELRKSLTSGSAEVQDLGRLNLTSESASPGSFSNLLESSSTGHHEATSPDHEDTGVNSNHSMSSPGHSMSSPGHSMSSPGHSMSSWTEAGPCNSTLAESHSTLTALLSTQTTLTSQ